MSPHLYRPGARRPAAVVGAALLSLILWGCGDGGQSTVELTDADSTSEVLVEPGDRIRLRLESNPTTGYSWQLSDMTTPGLVELESQEFEPPEDDEVVGAGGIEEFVFVVGDDGAGVLRLEYIRTFDDPPIPDRVVEYIVRIDEAPWPPVDGTDPPSTSTETAPGG